MYKIGNGIIGITKNDTARDRFCATWAERSHIAYDIKSLFGLIDDEVENDAIYSRKEALPTRMKQDEDAVSRIVSQFKRVDVFRISTGGNESVSGITGLDDE